MKPFKYLSPLSVKEAIAFHTQHRKAKYIGGGTDLI